MIKRLCLYSILGSLLGGCSAFSPRPTLPPIYVTATPAVASATETLANTAVIGPTEGITDTPPIFATFPTSTPTPLPTSAPTLTPSFTPTYTESPVPTQKAPKAVNCPTPPQGGFATIFNGLDAATRTTLGCPASPAVAISSAAVTFDNGRMIWASQLGELSTRVIYALYNNGAYQRYNDTWTEGIDPQSTGEVPPAGRYTPIRGIGKVWHENAAVKNGLGWALDTEVGTAAQMQRFDHGEMLYVASLNQTFIFIGGTNWRVSSTPF